MENRAAGAPSVSQAASSAMTRRGAAMLSAAMVLVDRISARASTQAQSFLSCRKRSRRYATMPSDAAMMGLSSRGNRKVIDSLPNWISPGLAASPAPTSPPINAWVVEIGNPAREAIITVIAAPMPTLKMKCGAPTITSGSKPLPENRCTSSWARNSDTRLPATVATVASSKALR